MSSFRFCFGDVWKGQSAGSRNSGPGDQQGELDRAQQGNLRLESDVQSALCHFSETGTFHIKKDLISKGRCDSTIHL